MANSDKPLELRVILFNTDEAEIVKNTMNPKFYEYQETKIDEPQNLVRVVFRCRSFDFSDYVNIKNALNKAYVAFVIEQALD